MSPSAHDIAEEIRRRRPGAGRLKVHKLLYYMQGWHLAWTGEPLFTERIEAWDNGPVVATLWADERHSRPRPTPRPLDGMALSTVEVIMDRYGGMSGRALMEQTHKEEPWREAGGGSSDPFTMSNGEIRHESLARWFSQDEDLQEHVREAQRLAERTDVYSFTALALSPETMANVERALSGERIEHERPQ